MGIDTDDRAIILLVALALIAIFLGFRSE